MHKQTLTVGIADLSGFVQLINAVGMEQAIAHLQDAFRAAGDAIFKHGGRIHKYLGDAVLFTFDDLAPAQAAAREIAQYRQAVGAPTGELTVRFYVGLCTGEVYLGPIGHPAFLQDDVMGEAVNRAFMLLKDARQNENGVAICDE